MKNELYCYVKLSVMSSEDKKIYVAYCPDLSLFSDGASEEEAEACLKDAISLYMKHSSDERKKRFIDSIKNRKYFAVEV